MYSVEWEGRAGAGRDANNPEPAVCEPGPHPDRERVEGARQSECHEPWVCVCVPSRGCLAPLDP